MTVADTRVEDIGDEAIHLKNQTVDSTVIGNSISRTGIVNAIYGERFRDSPPARATVQAARLPRDARVEIDAIAVVG